MTSREPGTVTRGSIPSWFFLMVHQSTTHNLRSSLIVTLFSIKGEDLKKKPHKIKGLGEAPVRSVSQITQKSTNKKEGGTGVVK